jgi:hypothetical protein
VILTALMAHPRKLIRQAVVTLLAGANTAAEDRVKGTRIEPHRKTRLPSIGVYTLTDQVDPDVSSDMEDGHVVDVEVTAWVSHTDAVPVDDAMDDIAEQIEAAMLVDRYLAGKAGGAGARLTGTTMQVVEDDGRSDPIIGIVTLTYAVEYKADLVAAPPADDFLTVHATTQIVGGIEDDTVPAEDTATVQEP